MGAMLEKCKVATLSTGSIKIFVIRLRLIRSVSGRFRERAAHERQPKHTIEPDPPRLMLDGEEVGGGIFPPDAANDPHTPTH